MAFRPTQSTSAASSKSSFFQQRDALVNDIAIVRCPSLSPFFSSPLPQPSSSLPPSLKHLSKPINPPYQELENVLQSINKLNRSLEGVIAVGNEFGAVEALWSQFEGVMAHEEETAKEDGGEGVEGEAEGGRGKTDKLKGHLRGGLPWGDEVGAVEGVWSWVEGVTA